MQHLLSDSESSETLSKHRSLLLSRQNLIAVTDWTLSLPGAYRRIHGNSFPERKTQGKTCSQHEPASFGWNRWKVFNSFRASICPWCYPYLEILLSALRQLFQIKEQRKGPQLPAIVSVQKFWVIFFVMPFKEGCSHRGARGVLKLAIAITAILLLLLGTYKLEVTEK